MKIPKLLSGQKLAELTDRSCGHITYLSPEIIRQRHGVEVEGGSPVYFESAIEYIKNRMRKPKRRSKEK